MDISFPVTLQEKKYNVFDPSNPQMVSTDATLIVHVDAATQANIQALVVPAPANAHLSPAQLGAQYSLAELSSALQARLASGGN